MAARGSTKQRIAGSALGHTVLIAMSCVFLLPFAWLVGTSLKADDDVMEVPKSLKVLLPKGRFAPIHGHTQRVSVAQHPIDYPAKIVRWTDGSDRGQTALVRAADIVDGRVKRWFDRPGGPEAEMVAVEVIKDVPGSASDPWWRVEQHADGLPADQQPLWDCVAESDIAVHLAPRWRNYLEGLAKYSFARFYRTTTLVTIAFVFLMVLSCSFTAYGFGVLEWPGRNVVFFVMLCTMMLPAHVTLIPVFVLFKYLGWINTFRPLVVPALFGSAFFVFLLRQFYLTIPRSLIDAARIDGCSELRIWWQLALPLSKPALMTVGLFSFLHAWNDFLGPLVYLTSEKKYTLSLGLAMFQGEYGTEYGMLMAMTVLTVIPILVLFFVAQKTFIQGVKLSGMKE